MKLFTRFRLFLWLCGIVLTTIIMQSAWRITRAVPSPEKKPTDSKELTLVPQNESVMTPGMKIKAVTPAGTMIIEAVDELTRSYTWEGATRSIVMGQRGERWHGSLGLAYPGAGNHWKDHNGISRCVAEEGQRHFKSVAEAMKWIRQQTWQPYVYRDDGLMVGWSKVLPRRQLNVDVWQILINNKKPKRMPGSRNASISVSYSKPQSLSDLLLEAVNKNQPTTMRNLLNRGASPDARNKAGSPALLVAANRGYETIVRLLLDKGANPDLRGVEGSTALLEATVYERPKIVKMLLDKKANTELAYERGIMNGTTPLISAVSFEPNLQIAQLLLAAGANVNAQAADGNTALIMAADAGNLEVARLLLLYGAKVDMRGFLGSTALMEAVGKGNVSMARLLIASGANVNARDDETQRLAAQAAFVGDNATLEKLAKSGTLNKRHENGPSMLSIAKIQKNKAMIELLEQAGAKE